MTLAGISRASRDRLTRGWRHGFFLSLDLFLFFVFFEIVLVPVFLIGGWGCEGREYAATKFFLYTMAGSAFMLVSILTTVFIARDDGVGRSHSTSSNSPRSELCGVDRSMVVLRFRNRICSEGSNLPAAMATGTQAPTAGSVVLAGVMLNWAHMASCVSVFTFSPKRLIGSLSLVGWQ